VRSGRARRFSDARQAIGLVGSIAFGIALVVFLIVSDATLVVRAHERSGSSLLPAILGGTAAAIGTVLAVAWYRRRVDDIGRGARRMLGRAGLAWGGAFVVAFLWTHPMRRADELATPLEVAVTSYVLVIVVAAVAVLPFAVRRLAR
jgi:hypothetical protein